MPVFSPVNNPNNRIIRLPSVQMPELWPKAPSQYGFILEAINLVGEVLFSGEWNGKELLSVVWLESPKAKRMREKQARRPVKAPRSIVSTTSASPAKVAPVEHVNDWYAETLNKDWESNNQAAQRLCKAVDWLAQRCRDGELTSYARLQTGGGNLMQMRASEWNIDDPLGHFVANGGHKRHCVELKYSGPYETFLFFKRQELRELLTRQPDAPLTLNETDLSQLSPYLQLAIRVALKREYFSMEACETQGVREAEIESAWPDLISEIGPVQSMVKAIGKVINFPNPDAIRKGQLGGRTSKTGATVKL